MILSRGLFIVLFATASSMHSFAQAPAGTAAVAPAVAVGNIPFKNPSFEEPVVVKRTVETERANPARIDTTDWGKFVRKPGKGEGALNIGMTNEIARTGKQSIYVDFAGITGMGYWAKLMTELIPVKPGVPYRVGMWGRMDKERPLTLDQRRPYVRMEFEFYQRDEKAQEEAEEEEQVETQVGDTEHRVMRLPGSLKKLLFTSTDWNEAFGVVRAPAGAALMKVSYVFEIPKREAGRTDGIIFFDDAFFEELPVNFPIDASDAPFVDSDDEDEDETSDATVDPLKKPVPVR